MEFNNSAQLLKILVILIKLLQLPKLEKSKKNFVNIKVTETKMETRVNSDTRNISCNNVQNSLFETLSYFSGFSLYQK